MMKNAKCGNSPKGCQAIALASKLLTVMRLSPEWIVSVSLGWGGNVPSRYAPDRTHTCHFAPRADAMVHRIRAMSAVGLTRARSMGPLVEAVVQCGASVERLFARAGLPPRLIDDPDHLIPLRDQLALVEHARRELGDATLPVRLSSDGGVNVLGPFAALLRTTATLGDAIDCASRLINRALQTATKMQLARHGPDARWTYHVAEPVEFGRQANELLALGYMRDLVRMFVGKDWQPEFLVMPGELMAQAAVEQALGVGIARGAVATLAMPMELLDAPNPMRTTGPLRIPPSLPDEDDFVGIVTELVRTSTLLDQQARVDWVAKRLGISSRTLQRQLAIHGRDFRTIRQAVSCERAHALLAAGMRVTEIAYELGYSDPAHFSRAFRAWTGRPPQRWR
ncbi:AraC family transcriptional regulator [Burkholderia vietnamiensis]|uniref:AraC family transcriptional regulator n=1 Tax=Burkholderia vietnamiensis TaxID=60552 RepID=UPI002012A80D|nr:AraC family transcriptional regulator [Burkholderia vietnamiensis]